MGEGCRQVVFHRAAGDRHFLRDGGYGKVFDAAQAEGRLAFWRQVRQVFQDRFFQFRGFELFFG